MYKLIIRPQNQIGQKFTLKKFKINFYGSFHLNVIFSEIHIIFIYRFFFSLNMETFESCRLLQLVLYFLFKIKNCIYFIIKRYNIQYTILIVREKQDVFLFHLTFGISIKKKKLVPKIYFTKVLFV